MRYQLAVKLNIDSWRLSPEFSIMNLVKILLPIMATMPLLCDAQQTESQRFLSNLLTRAVAQINATTPQILDNETRLEYAATYKNVIIYNNTMMNYSAENVELAVFEEFIEKKVIEPLCVNKSLAIFIDLKVIMVYRYHGKYGRFVSEFIKDMSTCTS